MANGPYRMAEGTTVTDVVIYTTAFCGYCVRAKALLKSRGIAFREIDVSHDHDERMRLVERTGLRTVPQIFINDRSIGGYDELAAIDRQGGLVGGFA